MWFTLQFGKPISINNQYISLYYKDSQCPASKACIKSPEPHKKARKGFFIKFI